MGNEEEDGGGWKREGIGYSRKHFTLGQKITEEMRPQIDDILLFNILILSRR